MSLNMIESFRICDGDNVIFLNSVTNESIVDAFSQSLIPHAKCVLSEADYLVGIEGYGNIDTLFLSSERIVKGIEKIIMIVHGAKNITPPHAEALRKVSETCRSPILCWLPVDMNFLDYNCLYIEEKFYGLALCDVTEAEDEEQFKIYKVINLTDW